MDYVGQNGRKTAYTLFVRTGLYPNEIYQLCAGGQWVSGVTVALTIRQTHIVFSDRIRVRVFSIVFHRDPGVFELRLVCEAYNKDDRFFFYIFQLQELHKLALGAVSVSKITLIALH